MEAGHWTDMGVAQALGERLKTLRLQRNLSQEEMAERMDVAVRTIYALEAGKTKLVTFISALRVLGQDVSPEHFVHVPRISPMQALKENKTRRQRARKKSR